MKINPFHYVRICFGISVMSCVLNVLAANQLYGNEDYVYNFLQAGPGGDSGGIPVGGAIDFLFFVKIISRN
ncbi:MAG: hypothetical protein WAU24_12195 [Chitinophagaceae bacterium]